MSNFISLRIITKLIAYNINSNFLSFIFEKVNKKIEISGRIPNVVDWFKVYDSCSMPVVNKPNIIIKFNYISYFLGSGKKTCIYSLVNSSFCQLWYWH